MYARGIGVGDPSAHAVDYVEPLVWVVLVQAHLEIHRVAVNGKADGVPLDVKDAVRRSARDRGENAAPVCPCGTAAQSCVGQQVMPQGEDGEVIRAPIDRGRKAAGDVTVRLVHAHKVQPPIGIDVHGVKGLTVQLERKRQGQPRVAVVAVIARIAKPRHNRIGAGSYCVLVTGRRRRRWCWGRRR